MYDTSDPHDWKYYKTMFQQKGFFGILDSSLSPDNGFVACSGINSVCIGQTTPGTNYVHKLDFTKGGSPQAMMRHGTNVCLLFSPPQLLPS